MILPPHQYKGILLYTPPHKITPKYALTLNHHLYILLTYSYVRPLKILLCTSLNILSCINPFNTPYILCSLHVIILSQTIVPVIILSFLSMHHIYIYIPNYHHPRAIANNTHTLFSISHLYNPYVLSSAMCRGFVTMDGCVVSLLHQFFLFSHFYYIAKSEGGGGKTI